MTDSDDLVFKALADPTRRRMLDMMRQAPRTTGELASAFEEQMTRFGVMKHLGVLESAGLLAVRREGRFRHNHLNAVPIREIYERWVGRYAGATAGSLLNLKRIAEQQGTSPMTTVQKPSVEAFHIAQEVRIAAAPDRVWAALTTDIGQWWAYRTLAEKQGEVSLDATIGGHFMERNGEDAALWGTVVYIEKGKRLRLQGPLGASHTGVVSLYNYELEADGDGTLLKLDHRGYGENLDDMGEKYDAGWRELFGTYLSAYLESGKTWRDLEAEKS